MVNARTVAAAVFCLNLAVSTGRAQDLDIDAALEKAKAVSESDPVEAMRLYRTVFRVDPAQKAAYDALRALAETTELPRDESAETALAASFGPEFTTLATEHFLLVYDTEKVWTENRAELLERAHDRFFEEFQSHGLQPVPVHERLVCLLFNEYSDYVKYGQTTDRQNVGGFNGYYSGRTNRIAYYNDKTGPQYIQYVKHVEDLKKRLPGFTARLRQARGNAQQLRQIRFEMNQVRREMAWYQTRINAFARKGNTATTIHEAVHQLSYNCGIQGRGVSYPFWLSEGLATNFEAPDDLQAFGPSKDNLNRRQNLAEAYKNKRVLPLQTMIGLAGPKPIGPVTVLDEYAQSWGLFRFCYLHHQEGLLAYLRDMRSRDSGHLSPEQHVEAFEKAMGPIADMQEAWIQHLKRLR